MVGDGNWNDLVVRGRRVAEEHREAQEALGKVVLQVEAEYGYEGVQRMAWFFASGERDLSKMRKRGWKGALNRSALAAEMTFLEGCKRVALKGLLR
jgi:hypothetical protein